MSDNKEQYRAEFEEWAQKEGYNTSPHPTNSKYWDSHVEARWQGYTAGRSAQPVVLSDDAIIAGVRAYVQAGKRGLDLQSAMREAIQEAILAAKEQA